MKIDDLYPSKYIKGEDVLKGKDGQVTLTIRSLTIEEMGKERERNPVLWFNGTEKGLVLGKTNAMTIKSLYGNESDSWAGKRITLTTKKVHAFGDWHDSVVVQAPPAAAQKVAAPDKDRAGSPAPASTKKRYEDWESTEYRRRIVQLAARHDSIFMEDSDVTALKELMDEIDDDNAVMSAGDYSELRTDIDDTVGSPGFANAILTYLFGRVIGTDTPPGEVAGSTMMNNITDYDDALQAVFSIIKQEVKAS